MNEEFEKEKLDMLLEEGDWDSLLEDDDEFDAAVKEEYMKEAEEIEQALFSEGMPRETCASEEETRASYERLVELMKKRGIYREDAPAEGAAADSVAMSDCAAADAAASERTAADGVTADIVGTDSVPMESASMSGSSAEPDGRTTMDFAGNGLAFMPGTDGTAGFRIAARHDSVREPSRRAMLRQFKVVRVAGFAVACLLGVFLVSMTSQANRQHIARNIGILLGNDAYLLGDNNTENELPLHDEEEARKKIEEELGIKVPVILYYPDSFEFYDYRIQKNTAFASIEYMYKDNIITLDICNYDTKSSSQNVASHGDQQTTFYIEKDDISVRIMENMDEDEEMPRYIAQWEIENISYQFSGRMEKEIFQEIIEKLKFR